ncbi:phosphoinositide 3-kinase adapter protein 1 isoform X1 [Micropterus salmoides]|uniref:phosphoinositide 3-kinase adapter protein 1 isoform X1 n=1 Tax=Micropterus salmoides TaxID=27706 RepID=UPI0018EB448E|nr:phosphoinositide 3-kinase adapter protein 1 isoform X1 [Micropterus salmoides]
MEEHMSSIESANPESLSKNELLILHTADAQEWAMYLEHILKASPTFRQWSIVLYAVSPADQLHGYNFDYYQNCQCIVLLLSGSLLDMLYEPEPQRELQRLLYPPHRVVALLCGVTEDDMLMEIFEDWQSWRKIYADDEPAVYVSTILESIDDSRRVWVEHESEAATEAEVEAEAEAVAAAELHITAAYSTENPTTDETEEVVSEEQKETVLKDKEPVSTGISSSEEISTPTHLTCLTVQPNRVLCGELETLFIIFKHKIDDQSVQEVEFLSENGSTKRIPGTVENEYTISVTAPDMPAGVVSLTMYTDQSCVSLKPVTYYTNMGEVSRFVENATDPVNFICQAFNLTSNATESLDNMLTDSLKSRMPETGLQLFGIRQIEEDNMAAYQRNEELPTLLHFAAKYGLRKLTTILLQCPGALQAYSVMNKYGDYPNTLAEKSGFSDLRQFMDEFVETADMLKSHFEDSINTEESADVYELMSTSSQDIMMKYSGCPEDIYESMLGIDPDCAEDLYEVMSAVDENPEEAMLRKFFQAKPNASVNHDNNQHRKTTEDNHNDLDQIEEEEDPYNLCPEDIYDIVDENSTYNPAILNRPPAPIPRPESEPEPEKPMTYISRVFSDKDMSQTRTLEMGYPPGQPAAEPFSPVYDPYAGMKTPGQRQLISLQERVKVGEITVDEAVQEFKSWQLDHERRANSIRYQQENLKKLRDSITRRHKDRQKTGKELDYEISAPLQRNLYWGSSVTLECSVYESTPRVVAPPPAPAAHAIQRGTWKTGSTSSTSSTESNRLSTHSTFSYSSGTEPDFEDTIENVPPPPRPPRPSDAASLTAPPRIPPRIPESRVPEKMHERYISCPTRAPPQRPTHRHTNSAPPIPRRLR